MSHHRQLKKETGALLAALGQTPDQVAASLEQVGIAGVPRSNRGCAVALYLNAVLGTEPSVRGITVGHCSLLIDLVQPADRRPAGRLLIQLPKPVRRFVAAFDARQYPGVVRPRPVVDPVGSGAAGPVVARAAD